jgi:hypothetical protein
MRPAIDKPAGGRPRGATGTACPWRCRSGGMSGVQPNAAMAVTFASLKYPAPRLAVLGTCSVLTSTCVSSGWA